MPEKTLNALVKEDSESYKVDGKVQRPRSIRIPKPDKKMLDKVHDLAKRCTPVRYIAAELGMAERTFYEHMEKFPQLAHAVSSGRALRYKRVIGTHTDLMESATSEAVRLNAAHFELKTQHGWRENIVDNAPKSLTINVNLGTNDKVTSATEDDIHIIDVTPTQ